MDVCLEEIRNWGELVVAARYRVSLLARSVHVSSRQLDRFFHDGFGRSPKGWMEELRLIRSAKLLSNGAGPKVVAIEMHFSSPSHFSRDLFRYFGSTPTHFIGQDRERRKNRQRELASVSPGDGIPTLWLENPNLLRAETALLQLVHYPVHAAQSPVLSNPKA